MSDLLTMREVERLERCLNADGVAVIPTDTVYGLACNPESATAINRIYELKRRPPRKPAAVMYFDLDAALAALPELGERTRTALRKLLPGAVTLLLPNPQARFPLACEGGLLGLRVPRLGGRLAPLAGMSASALQSSANLSGGPDPRRLEDVPAALRGGADLVLDAGELPGTASTVIDLSRYEQAGDWRVVREGPLGSEALAEALAISGSC